MTKLPEIENPILMYQSAMVRWERVLTEAILYPSRSKMVMGTQLWQG